MAPQNRMIRPWMKINVSVGMFGFSSDSVLVIGMGRFGSSVAQSLIRL
eukprot:gene31103-38439_t